MRFCFFFFFLHFSYMNRNRNRIGFFFRYYSCCQNLSTLWLNYQFKIQSKLCTIAALARNKYIQQQQSIELTPDEVNIWCFDDSRTTVEYTQHFYLSNIFVNMRCKSMKNIWYLSRHNSTLAISIYIHFRMKEIGTRCQLAIIEMIACK